MTTYIHTPEQLATIQTAQKQLLDLGDEKTAATLAWVLTAEPATFEDAMRPAIKWLNDNCNPHASVIVTPTSAELVTGERCLRTEDYLRD